MKTYSPQDGKRIGLHDVGRGVLILILSFASSIWTVYVCLFVIGMLSAVFVHSHWELLMTAIFGIDRQPNDKMDPMAPSNLEFFITGRNNQRRREYGTTRYYTGLKIYTDIIEQGQ